MNLKRILILLEKESRDFFSSRAWIIALALPLFIVFLFSTVYKDSETPSYHLGIINPVDPALSAIISKAEFKTTTYPNLHQAQAALNAKNIDGILYENTQQPHKFSLQIQGADPTQVSMMVNALNLALLHIYTDEDVPQIELVSSTGSFKNLLSSMALPIWLIQIILTICLLQNSAAIAEEKSRHTLHSILVSPATLGDYFAAKLTWNMLLGMISIILTIELIGFDFDPFYLIGFSLLGCGVYTCSALLIGLLAPNALFARTVSTVFYLVSALPIMVKNTSLAWKDLLNIIPSFPLIYGLEQAFLEAPLQGNVSLFIIILLGESLGLLLLISQILKHQLDF